MVRTFKGTKEVGVNRVWWDLRYEAPRRPKLRTAPPGRPWVPLGPEGWRPLVTWDLDLNAGLLGPLAPPGTYTVKLQVGDFEKTESLTVRKDPHSAGSEEDIRVQVARLLEMRDELNEMVDMIDEIEWVRRQLENLRAMFQGKAEAAAVLEAAKELEGTALAVEGNLFDIHLTGAREDAFRAPMKLYERMLALASDLGANSADFPPTTQQVEVHEEFKRRLDEYRNQFKDLMERELPAFRKLVREKDLAPAIW